MQKPYIGITDFASADDVRCMVGAMHTWKRGTSLPHQLMVGVMMSHKTLHDLPTKWAAVWPKKEEYQHIFMEAPGVFNTLHYADYDAEGHDLVDDLIRATQLCGPHLHAVQLDMVWPKPEAVKAFATLANATRQLSVVLQVGTMALEYIHYDADLLGRRINAYGDAVQYVLIDWSMGKGKLLDVTTMLFYIRRLKKERPDLGIAIAGGLGPDTLGHIAPIIEEFPDTSIDAQSRLRPSGNAMDPVDWRLASLYLECAVKLIDLCWQR